MLSKNLGLGLGLSALFNESTEKATDPKQTEQKVLEQIEALGKERSSLTQKIEVIDKEREEHSQRIKAIDEELEKLTKEAQVYKKARLEEEYASIEARQNEIKAELESLDVTA